MTLDQFWEASEVETIAMALGWREARKLEHQNRAWFAGHVIGYLGHFEKKPDIGKIIDNLNGPYRKTFAITSKADLIDFKDRFGIDLLPEESASGRPE